MVSNYSGRGIHLKSMLFSKVSIYMPSQLLERYLYTIKKEVNEWNS